MSVGPKPTVVLQSPLWSLRRVAYYKAKLIHQKIHGFHTCGRACCPRQHTRWSFHCKDTKNIRTINIRRYGVGKFTNLRLNDIEIVSVVALSNDYILGFHFLLEHGVENSIHLLPIKLNEWGIGNRSGRKRLHRKRISRKVRQSFTCSGSSARNNKMFFTESLSRVRCSSVFGKMTMLFSSSSSSSGSYCSANTDFRRPAKRFTIGSSAISTDLTLKTIWNGSNIQGGGLKSFDSWGINKRRGKFTGKTSEIRERFKFSRKTLKSS